MTVELKEVRLFFLRLSDGRFVKSPGFAVFAGKDQTPAIWTEGNIAVLSWGVGDPFGLTLVERKRRRYRHERRRQILCR